MPQFFGFERVAIPGPRTVPFVGPPHRLWQLLDDPIAVVLRLRERGEVVALIDRSPAVVCVFGAERNREVLSAPGVFRHDETLFRGPPGSAMDRLRFSIVTINGDLHRRHRKLMQPAFHRGALDGYAAAIVEVMRVMLGRWRVGAVGDVDVLCRQAALAVAMRCLYGLDVSDEAESLGHLAAEWVELVTDPGTLLLPFDLPGTAYRRVLRLAEVLTGRLRALIERKRAAGGDQRDAMALLLAARDDDGRPLSDDELVAEAVSLFIAGHETMAMTLTWTLMLLERHPEVHAAVMAEIGAVLGDRDPGPEDIPRMPALDRVIKESMRILSSVPLLFLRVCAEATQVGAFAVPKGANVLVSPLATHHDPALFAAPRRFSPDRWLGPAPPPYAYLPYSAGPRTCVGMLFADRALRLMLPMILRRFRLSIPAGTRIDRLTRGNILKPRRGLPMRVDPASAPARPPASIAGDIRDLVEM